MIEWDVLIRSLLAWLFFGFTHSLLASEKVKQIMPMSGRRYRIFYNFLAGILFLAVLSQLPSISTILLSGFNLSTLRFLVFIIILISGVLITSLGLLKWDIEGFVGLADEDDPLNTSGIYAFSRHPVYSGFILMFLSMLIISISANTLAWVIGGGGYFVLGSIPEENKLSKIHAEYEEYKDNVGRFIPLKKRHFSYFLQNK